MKIKKIYSLDLEDVCHAVARYVYDTYGAKFDVSDSIVDFLYNESGNLNEIKIYKKDEPESVNKNSFIINDGKLML